MNRLIKKSLSIITIFIIFLVNMLPVSVRAEEKDYWTESKGTVGTIERITDSGYLESSFGEGYLTVENEEAFCIDINADFRNGYKKRQDLHNRLSKEQISKIALSLEYFNQSGSGIEGLNREQIYLMKQCIVWRNLSKFLGWNCGGVRPEFALLSSEVQNSIFKNAEDFADKNANRYECGGYLYSGDGQDLGQFWAKLNVGYGKIKKTSSNTLISEGNSLYELSHAKYGVYDSNLLTNKIGELMTDTNGESEVLELPVGKFFIKEIEAPEGFLKDETIYLMEISTGQTTELVLKDEPKYTPVELEICKVDKEVGYNPQGRASLADAEFKWSYYDGFYTEDNLPKKAAKTWITKTVNENGKYVTKLEKSYQVYGDDLYISDKSSVLPLGTLVLEEVKTPKGYLLQDYEIKVRDQEKKFTGKYIVQIIDDKGKVRLKGTNYIEVMEKIIRGGIKIQKRDLETKSTKAQGSASLKDAQFNIISLNKENVFVEGKIYKNGEVIKTLYTNSDGNYQTEKDFLPYGKYRVIEKAAPEGYLLGEDYVDFEVSENGKIIDLSDKEHSLYNQVKRGDLKGIKISEKTHKRLSNIPFKITSKTTGESHTIITDKNGEFSTESSWVKHSNNTNRGKSSEDGIWFGSSQVDNSKGALLYDTYIVEEMRSDSNNGYKLIPPFEVVISKDSVTVDLGTLTNEYKNSVTIKTFARGENNSKEIEASENTKVVDMVNIRGLEKGKKYKIKGYQMVRETKKELLVSNKIVMTEKEITADKEELTIDMIFSFNSRNLSGKNLVTFEELYELDEQGNWQKISEHKDINDEDQTVYVKANDKKITIKTYSSGKSGEKELEVGKDTVIIDTVDMKHLKEGKTYRLCGWQIIKENEKELVINSIPVKGEKEFIAKSRSMKETVEFKFDSSNLYGKSLVTFEELYELNDQGDWIKVAEHKDINDIGQTITFKKETVEKPKEPSHRPGGNIKKGSLPQTGDSSSAFTYIGCFILSIAGLILVGKSKHKNK